MDKWQSLDLVAFGFERESFRLVPPLGNNALTAKAIFLHRKHYRDDIYPQQGAQPYDAWYNANDFLYGRFNKENMPILVDEKHLRQLANTKETILTLHFVADAFDDFRKHFLLDERIGTGKSLKGSAFQDIQAVGGYSSPTKAYHEHMAVLYDVCINNYIEKRHLGKKIHNFSDFLRHWLDFIDRVALVFPITRTQFISSRFCSPMCSGLMIETKKMLHGNDFIKYKTLLADKQFYHYRDVAELYGFQIDKNAPWRLVANIASPQMIKYLKRYKTSPDTIYEDAYIPVSIADLDVIPKQEQVGNRLLKTYLLAFWNSYAISHPFAISSEINTQKDTASSAFLTSMVRRVKLTAEELEERYPLSWWLRLYVYVRGKETGQRWSQVQYDKIVQTSLQYLYRESLAAAIGYININVYQKPTSYLSVPIITDQKAIQSVLDEAHTVSPFQF
jgi:hypothetical protein